MHRTCSSGFGRSTMSDDEGSMAQTVRLVGEAQGGDHDALEVLFRRYLPKVRQIAALRLGKSTAQISDVEDIVQEALLEAFRGLDRFEESQGKFCNWLAKIVENRIKMNRRSESAKKRGGGGVLRFADTGSQLRPSIFAGNEATPSQNMAGRETEDRIHAALLAMEPRHREVMTQRFICEMSFAEIAELMEFERESSARSLYCMALKDLRKRLGLR